jgi:heme/copper-type cytochrome/quinol oxidase subunit 1
VIVFLFGVGYAFARKARAEANPWGVGATTLEWTLPSPPRFTPMKRCRKSHDDLTALLVLAERRWPIDVSEHGFRLQLRCFHAL